MNMTYKALRKTVIFIIGSIVFIVGVILLLIPGPGLVTMALGLLILSTEFEWAEKHLKSVRKKIQAIYEKSKNKNKKPQDDGKRKQ